MRRFRALRSQFYVLFVLIVGFSEFAKAQDSSTFAIDLAERQIAITAGFNGANMLIFGAINRGKVILSIEGVGENYRVRKKNRVGGIWVNNEKRELPTLPSFYVLATSENALEELSFGQRLKHRLGYDSIASDISVFDANAREFLASLIEIKEQKRMYQLLPGTIKIARSGLFRVNVSVPAAVPPGNYTIRALSVENGEILQSYQTALAVNKVGFGAWVYSAAHQYPQLYGLGAIIVSVLSGLLASLIFNRKKSRT